MTVEALQQRLHEIVAQQLPLPGRGHTAERHRLLAATAREDVSLAKLAEAHWDAVAILSEAGRTAEPGLLYAVWASETPSKILRLECASDAAYRISGSKPFCSGIGLADRALVTVNSPEPCLVEVDLRRNQKHIQSDLTIWKVDAFRATQTGGLTFVDAEVDSDAIIGEPGWYLDRPAFWHGACGPAACWAGGAAGLLDFALKSKRDDAHTVAHVGAMQSNVWGMYSLLERAGHEIDLAPFDVIGAHLRALQLRHLIEQMGSDTLHRFSRAYGPHPLAMNEDTSRRYQEVDLYMRQSHGDRDLESMGHLLRSMKNESKSCA